MPRHRVKAYKGHTILSMTSSSNLRRNQAKRCVLAQSAKVCINFIAHLPLLHQCLVTYYVCNAGFFELAILPRATVKEAC